MRDLLREIFENRKSEVALAKERHPLDELREIALATPLPGDFVSALQRAETSIIAEIKFTSPSRPGHTVQAGHKASVIARDYARGGAVAISVLTEERYFSGGLALLKEVREAVSLPLLRKDFIFDVYQVYEARAFGADAFLLIADYLARDTIEILLKTGRELGLAALVEIHSSESLQKIAGLPVRLLGINNRDLTTLHVDVETTHSILDGHADLLREKVLISESGIDSRKQILGLEKRGIQGFLIGAALMKSTRPIGMLRELRGVK